MLSWAEEAQRDGARLSSICKVLGLNKRTLERWRARGGGSDRRQGPRTSPANKLSAVERAQVLKAANSPEFRDKSPHQIVPLLADRGVYLASESTFYRVLREAKMLR
ncbi:IS3 family transposase, partial [Lujinxingia litoralis]